MYVCSLIDEATNQCMNWIAFSVIPTLSDEARDTLLIIVISTYFTVFVIRQVKGLIGKSD